MKPLGIVRQMDYMGRVCIPKEIRKAMSLQDGDSVEILATDKGVMIKKHCPGEGLRMDITSLGTKILNDEGISGAKKARVAQHLNGLLNALEV